jgi:hypothetical protein
MLLIVHPWIVLHSVQLTLVVLFAAISPTGSNEMWTSHSEIQHHGDSSPEYRPMDRVVHVANMYQHTRAWLSFLNSELSMLRGTFYREYQEPEPSLTESDIDKHTEFFEFPEFKQGFCVIDQEEIMQGDRCRRILKVRSRAFSPLLHVSILRQVSHSIESLFAHCCPIWRLGTLRAP